ncbi:MAG: ABC-three component system protein [Clostridia bacterium]
MQFDYIEFVDLLADNDSKKAKKILRIFLSNITDTGEDTKTSEIYAKERMITKKTANQAFNSINNISPIIGNFKMKFTKVYNTIPDIKNKSTIIFNKIMITDVLRKSQKIAYKKIFDDANSMNDYQEFLLDSVVIVCSRKIDKTQKPTINNMLTKTNSNSVYVNELVKMYKEQDNSIVDFDSLKNSVKFRNEFFEQIFFFFAFESKRSRLSKTDKTLIPHITRTVYNIISNCWDYIYDINGNCKFSDGYDRFNSVMILTSYISDTHSIIQDHIAKGTCHYLIDERDFNGWIL